MSFRLFGFPIRISPTFLILGLFLFDARLGWQGIVAWVGAAFTSVIIHELGHAFAVRGYGGRVEQITLHGLGGATAWTDPAKRIDWGRRIAIAAAGAGLGFVIAGVLYGLVRAGLFGRAAEQVIVSPFRVLFGIAIQDGLWLVFFLGAFIWVTMAWGLINWLPIGGLDGWHILAELLEKWLPGRGRQVAAVVGLIVALIAAFFLFRLGMTFGAVILVLFALQTLGSR
ncbi:MAG: site-2 protease family protein [Acidimicrobiia bacterium]|nr:site-2 protease family protein [Acidimicrobiia bacterium]MDQ3501172.1 hypothetical protein [Actinomycetota bacterium]